MFKLMFELKFNITQKVLTSKSWNFIPMMEDLRMKLADTVLFSIELRLRGFLNIWLPKPKIDVNMLKTRSQNGRFCQNIAREIKFLLENRDLNIPRPNERHQGNG